MGGVAAAGFGEIALLEQVPRAAGEARRLVRERLPSKHATIAP